MMYHANPPASILPHHKQDGRDSHPADEGCHKFPCCLRCPLPACRYDTETKRAIRDKRDAEIIRLYQEGKPAGDIGVILHCSVSTVRQTLARWRYGK